MKSKLKPLTLIAFLSIMTLFLSTFPSCNIINFYKDISNKKEITYEELFLGRWEHMTNEEFIVFNFKYEDGVYCGGAFNNELDLVIFEKYAATKTTLIFWFEDGEQETLDYYFDNENLYIGNKKFKKEN